MRSRRPGLTPVAESPPFGIYELQHVSVVDPLLVRPSVYEEPAEAAEGVPADFDAFALDWYGTMDALDHVVVTEGPAEWDRISSVDDLSDEPTGASADAVTNVVATNNEVSFDTTAIGVPHLVKVSYFPNWTVTGADGPFRATPSLMVVVPTETHVSMSFHNTWAENGGNTLSVVGLLGLGYYGYRRRKGWLPAFLS